MPSSCCCCCCCATVLLLRHVWHKVTYGAGRSFACAVRTVISTLFTRGVTETKSLRIGQEHLVQIGLLTVQLSSLQVSSCLRAKNCWLSSRFWGQIPKIWGINMPFYAGQKGQFFFLYNRDFSMNYSLCPPHGKPNFKVMNIRKLVEYLLMTQECIFFIAKCNSDSNFGS